MSLITSSDRNSTWLRTTALTCLTGIAVGIAYRTVPQTKAWQSATSHASRASLGFLSKIAQWGLGTSGEAYNGQLSWYMYDVHDGLCVYGVVFSPFSQTIAVRYRPDHTASLDFETMPQMPWCFV